MESVNDNEWWGYSKEHGWVVLDRSISENQPGNPKNLLFVKCVDWTIYEENRDNWKPPKYIFERNYISNLSTAERQQLIQLKNEYKYKKRSLHIQYSLVKRSKQKVAKEIIIERHKKYLEQIGKVQGSYRVNAQVDIHRRITGCFNCKNHLDNALDLECTICGWIICDNCGACGCGFNQDKNTTIP